MTAQYYKKWPYIIEMKMPLYSFRMQGRKCLPGDAQNLDQSGHVVNI